MPARARAQGEQRPLESCDGQLVTAVDVRTLPPYPDGVLRRSRSLARIVRALHTTTKPELVRRFVILEPGQFCTDLRLSESERILRAQPFLAEASVRAFADSFGVRIDVVTVDEVSAVAGVAMRQSSPYLSALRLGSRNALGEGMYVSGEWREGDFYRDTYGARIVDYQFLGRPYQLSLVGRRRRVGSTWAGELSHPYLTDLQRIAWRASAVGSHDFIPLLRAGAGEVSVALDRHAWDVGGIVRIGPPGRLSLFGASLSSERTYPGLTPLIFTDAGPAVDTTAALGIAYTPARSARVNALWGVRNISFLRVRGFDALTGVQDVRRGFQLGTLFGRSLTVLGSRDDDIFLAMDVYAGGGTRNAFAAVQLLGEGRQDYDENRFDDILSRGRAIGYWRLASRHMLTTEIEWSGGWRQRIPFQLTLGDRDGGVRGYAASHAAGARRGIARVEERWFVGTPRDVADMGLAFFVDGGKLHAGDAPFGQNTPVRLGTGIGILAGFPPRSKQIWRLDIAVPIGSDPDAKWELRLSGGDPTRTIWRDPDDVARARSRVVPTSVFTWP